MIEAQMAEARFDFMSDADKRFVIKMTRALEELGYTYGDVIGDGICWGKYMLIFRKANVKSKNVVARIYIRDDSVAFRLFASQVTKHAAYISAAPEYVKSVFLGEAGACKHCRGETCKFRKEYEIDCVKIEKCNGETFTFPNAREDMAAGLADLFCEFYKAGRKNKAG